MGHPQKCPEIDPNTFRQNTLKVFTDSASGDGDSGKHTNPPTPMHPHQCQHPHPHPHPHSNPHPRPRRRPSPPTPHTQPPFRINTHLCDYAIRTQESQRTNKPIQRAVRLVNNQAETAETFFRSQGKLPRSAPVSCCSFSQESARHREFKFNSFAKAIFCIRHLPHRRTQAVRASFFFISVTVHAPAVITSAFVHLSRETMQVQLHPQ